MGQSAGNGQSAVNGHSAVNGQSGVNGQRAVNGQSAAVHRPGPADRDPRDGAVFRAALSTFATGVTAVCSRTAEGEPVGLAVSSFTSVSLDPPLVSFCVSTGSWTWDHIRRTGHFAVSVLAAEQGDLCRQLARPGDDRFADIAWSVAPSGSPVIDGALAWFDCTTSAEHPAGDHDIVVGAVEALSVDADAPPPLLFFRSELRGLSCA